MFLVVFKGGVGLDPEAKSDSEDSRWGASGVLTRYNERQQKELMVLCI